MEILAGEGLDLELVERLCAGEKEASAASAVAPEVSSSVNGGYAGDLEVQVKIGPEHQSLMQVVVKEHGCRFRLDFAQVYFNSRLQSEHAHLVQEIVQDATKAIAKSDNKKECIVADAMTGVGPFVVPLTSVNALMI